MSNLSNYNFITDKWDEVKVSTKFKDLPNTVVLTEDSTYVDIGITNFNPLEDVLYVFKNTTYQAKDRKYILNGGLLRIECVNGGTWYKNDVFDFVILKNVDKDSLPLVDASLLADGSLTIAKFASELQEYLTKIGTNTLTTTAQNLSDAVNEVNTQSSDIAVNVKSFGAKGDGITDDTIAIQSTINYLVDSKKSGKILIPSGKYKITSTIIIDITYVSLICQAEIDASAITSGAAIQIIGGSMLYNNIPYQNMSYIIGLFMRGAGSQSSSTGILFSSDTGATTGLSLYNCDIKEFGIGLQYRKNAYIINHFNISVGRCNVGIDMPSGYTNYGENISFFGGTISNNDIAVRNNNENGNFHFESTSIDYNSKQIEIGGGGVFLTDSHLECNNASRTTTQTPYTLGISSSCKLVIKGGVILFSNQLTTDYVFKTDNTVQGGGLILDGVYFFNATSTKELVGGEGLVNTNNLLFHDGNGEMGVSRILSKKMNKLADGGFESWGIFDALIFTDTVTPLTSRTTGTNINLSLYSGDFSEGAKCLKATKTYGSGSNAEFVLIIPVELLKQHNYRLKYKIPTTQTGTISVTDEYWNVSYFTQYGIPYRTKITTKSMRTITLNGTPTTWQELTSIRSLSKAPVFATHYVVRFNLFSMNAGDILIDEAIITAM